MPIIEYIRLGVAGLSIILQIIEALHNDQPPQIGNLSAEFLGKLGVVGKIKELQDPSIAQLAPDINDLFAKVHDLIQQAKLKQIPPASA